jgi:hypothetical protein
MMTKFSLMRRGWMPFAKKKVKCFSLSDWDFLRVRLFFLYEKLLFLPAQKKGNVPAQYPSDSLKADQAFFLFGAGVRLEWKVLSSKSIHLHTLWAIAFKDAQVAELIIGTRGKHLNTLYRTDSNNCFCVFVFEAQLAHQLTDRYWLFLQI